MSQPHFGLLLDIDGPISNPDAKQVIEPTIIDSLVALLEQGIPIIFNTGRADAFVRERVLSPLLAKKPKRVDRLHAVCEKGAVWLSVMDDYRITEEIDQQIAVPVEMWDAIESLVDERFKDTMFFDDEERTMVSVERNLHTSHEAYTAEQSKFVDAAFETLTAMGYGIEAHGRVGEDADGNVHYRIDATIIAVDIESIVVGKDLGASRAFYLLKRDGALPVEWRTVGDSDTDYAMATWLHDHGLVVKHVDVRGADRPDMPAKFEVLRPTKTVFDDAGAAYLRWLLNPTNPEPNFDQY